MTENRYRVAHLDGNREVDVWLTEQLQVTPAVMNAGQFTARDADAFARWATKHIVPLPEGGRWIAQKVRPDAAAHYSGVLAEAKADPEIGRLDRRTTGDDGPAAA